MASGGPPTFCATDHGCITCADGNGVCGEVDVALVGDVAPGDALLVHAGVAIARLEAPRAPA